MANEEKFIEEHLGKDNPYRVPEGYFAHFAEQVMSNLPQQPQQPAAQPVIRKARLSLLRPVLMAAACLCIAIFSITFYFNHASQDADENYISAVANTNNNTEEEEFMDEAADYAMLDNADIYACLSE